MKRRTLVSVFGLAVGLVATPVIADEAEERKDKTEQLVDLMMELEDGASAEEQEALEDFMEENFEGDDFEKMDSFVEEFEEDDFEEGDEPDLTELEGELEVEGEDNIFDQEPDDLEEAEDDLAELDDEFEGVDDDAEEPEDELALFEDELDDEEPFEREEEEASDEDSDNTGDEQGDEEFDEVAETDELDEPEGDGGNAELETPDLVIPRGGLVLKGFAAGMGRFEDQSSERAVATRSTTGADGVTVSITDNGSGGHNAVVTISGLTTVNPGDPSAPLGTIVASGAAGGPLTFEGESAAVGSDGTVTASSAEGREHDSFSHLVWGEWSHLRATGSSADRQDRKYSSLVVGNVTPDTADLSGLGTATYSGIMEGGFAAGGGADIDSVSGDLSLTADFGAKTFGGTYALNGQDLGSVVTNGTINSGSWTSPDGLSANLAGDSTMGAVSGDLQGAFFGPNAEEVGGNWELKIVGASGAESGGVGAGGFAGKR